MIWIKMFIWFSETHFWLRPLLQVVFHLFLEISDVLVYLHRRMRFHSGFPLFFVRAVWVVHGVQEETSNFKIIKSQSITTDESLVRKVEVLIEWFKPFREVSVTNFVHDCSSILFISKESDELLLEVSLQRLQNLFSIVPFESRLWSESILVRYEIVNGSRLNKLSSIFKFNHGHLSVLELVIIFKLLNFLHVWNTDILELNAGSVEHHSDSLGSSVCVKIIKLAIIEFARSFKILRGRGGFSCWHRNLKRFVFEFGVLVVLDRCDIFVTRDAWLLVITMSAHH